jgi:formylglycine-generating enzyme required for sulfatase activity
MADIFLSYARVDVAVARRLAEALEKRGWSVWWDVEIRAGEEFGEVILRELTAARCVVVLRSETSRTRPFVRDEARRALNRSILIPVTIDGAELPIGFGELHTRSLRAWCTEQRAEIPVELERDLERLVPRALPPAGAEPTRMLSERGGVELVRIPGGRFWMGSPETEFERYDSEGPRHEVTVPAFWLGKFAVTNEEYGRYLAANPGAPEPDSWNLRWLNEPRQPVVGVSWEGARAFARWAGGRLPSEAEWERACRAGTSTSFSFGATITITPEQVNYHNPLARKGLNRGCPVAVGSLPPNGWELHEMHGNVSEWVEDDWHESYRGAPADGTPWLDAPRGSGRVFRGGSYFTVLREARAAYRGQTLPENGTIDMGFRLARGPE